MARKADQELIFKLKTSFASSPATYKKRAELASLVGSYIDIKNSLNDLPAPKKDDPLSKELAALNAKLDMIGEALKQIIEAHEREQVDGGSSNAQP